MWYAVRACAASGERSFACTCQLFCAGGGGVKKLRYACPLYVWPRQFWVVQLYTNNGLEIGSCQIKISCFYWCLEMVYSDEISRKFLWTHLFYGKFHSKAVLLLKRPPYFPSLLLLSRGIGSNHIKNTQVFSKVPIVTIEPANLGNDRKVSDSIFILKSHADYRNSR